MKKLLSLILVSVLSIAVMAVDYNIFVGGVRVSSTNASDILNDGGKAQFDPSTSTLTLNNAKVYGAAEGTIHQAIFNQIKNLTIKVVGHNELYGAGNNPTGIYSSYDFSIVSGEDYSILDISSAGDKKLYTGITMLAACSIDGSEYDTGLTINIMASQVGILASGDDNALTIKDAQLFIHEAATAVFEGISDFTLDGAIISAPEVAAFDPMTKTLIGNHDDIVNGDLSIVLFTEYSLYVGGVQVTSVNASNVFNDGTVNFDPSDNTLTLRDADILIPDDTYKAGIWCGMPSLTIQLIGQNNIDNTIVPRIEEPKSIFCLGDLTIKSAVETTLRVNHGEQDTSSIGIQFGNNCIIDGSRAPLSIYIKHIDDAFVSSPIDFTNRLTIIKATVAADDVYHSIFMGVDSLSLNKCNIAYPAYGEFDASQRCIVVGDEPYYDGDFLVKAIVEPADVLSVAGIKVPYTTHIVPDILGDGGSVQYNDGDDEENEEYHLVLNNATITGDPKAEYKQGIYANLLSPLHLDVYGTNVIRVPNGINAIECLAGLEIKGYGANASLTLETSEDEDAGIKTGIYVAGECILGNVNLIIKHAERGIVYENKNEIQNICEINNCNVTMEYIDDSEFLHGFQSLSLNDCAIVEPEGAYFDEEKKDIYTKDNGNYFHNFRIAVPTAIVNNENENQNENCKVIENEQVVILRNGLRYNMLGQCVE